MWHLRLVLYCQTVCMSPVHHGRLVNAKVWKGNMEKLKFCYPSLSAEVFLLCILKKKKQEEKEKPN